MKTIKKLISGFSTNVGTIKVQELLPQNLVNTNPFILFHHGVLVADKNIPTHLQGVGPHPHRGFSPVSFIYKGGIHHQDSRGNNHIVYAGGTQWTNAGMGLIHSERLPKTIFDNGGVQEILQVWINTPAKHKMQHPQYFPATKEETPQLISEDKLITLLIPAGNYKNTKGIIPTFTNVTTIMGFAKNEGKFTFHFPTTENTILYVLNGKLSVNKTTILESKKMIVFDNNSEEFCIEALEETEFFVGSGEPINEPIATHGPFVMNTQTEILEAFRDYQLGKMGILVENKQ